MKEGLAGLSGAMRPDAPVICDVVHLGGRGALYLLALVQAHHARLKVTPTPEATTTLLSVLDALGVIRLDHQPTPLSHFTAGDKIPWSYTWSQVDFDDLEEVLTSYLTSSGRNELHAETWLRIWQGLIPPEVTAYLHHQLRIHQFTDHFLTELTPLLQPNESRFGLGHWRYACWAAVRSMASTSLQYPGNVELLKYTLASEIPRRLQIALGSQEGKLCFSPPHSLPNSSLTTALSNAATQLGDNFWRFPPSLDLIKSV